MNRKFKAGDIIGWLDYKYKVLGYGPNAVKELRGHEKDVDHLWVLEIFDNVKVSKSPTFFRKEYDVELTLIKSFEVKSNKPAWF